MANQCEHCKKSLPAKSKVLKCKICQLLFHVKCANITENTYDLVKAGSINWKCKNCPTQLNESFVVVMDDNDLARESVSEKNDLASFDFSICNLETMSQYLKVLGTVVAEIRKSQSFLCDKLDTILKENAEIRNQNSILQEKLLLSQNKRKQMEDRIDRLEYNIDAQERLKNKNNIVVSGLPANTDNLEEVFMEIFQKINCPIKKEDIISVSSLKSYSNQQNLQNSRKHYIFQLKSEQFKNEILEKKRKHHLFTSEFNLLQAGNREIFFQHHLSSLQKRIYYEAKQIKQELKYKYLWFKNNAICLRKEDLGEVYRFSKLSDITSFKDKYKLQQQ